jgi:hypothetical protein
MTPLLTERIMDMYRYGVPGRRLLPMLLFFFVVFTLCSGGFHRPWLFFWPLFFVVPFLVVAGIAAMFMMHGWHGHFPKRKHGQWFDGEKPKRTADSESDIYYL